MNSDEIMRSTNNDSIISTINVEAHLTRYLFAGVQVKLEEIRRWVW